MKTDIRIRFLPVLSFLDSSPCDEGNVPVQKEIVLYPGSVDVVKPELGPNFLAVDGKEVLDLDEDLKSGLESILEVSKILEKTNFVKVFSGTKEFFVLAASGTEAVEAIMLMRGEKRLGAVLQPIRFGDFRPMR